MANGGAWERRKKQRFPLMLAGQCRPTRISRVFNWGLVTTNICSGGALCQLLSTVKADSFKIGMTLYMEVDWPARLNDSIPLKFAVRCYVTRIERENNCLAMRFTGEQEFRTTSSGPRPLQS